MKKEHDYSQDIAEIRMMMERSSKFLSLSGRMGILIGIYALLGAAVAYLFFHFNPTEVMDLDLRSGTPIAPIWKIILLGIVVIILTIGTVIYYSAKRAKKLGEKVWSPTARRMFISLATPLVAGGILLLILLSKGLTGLVAPLSLVFYGLALIHAAKFTYDDLRTLGMIQIALGLLGSIFIPWGLLLWAIGFGVIHIVYGIYMHYKYEK